MNVQKHGRTTGLTSGSVEDIHCDVVCGVTPEDPDAGSILLKGQFRIKGENKVFSIDGDSGSLIVLENSSTAIGLLFAAPNDGSYGLANHIETVFTELNLKLA
jgi:hypothetical protein